MTIGRIARVVFLVLGSILLFAFLAGSGRDWLAQLPVCAALLPSRRKAQSSDRYSPVVGIAIPASSGNLYVGVTQFAQFFRLIG